MEEEEFKVRCIRSDGSSGKNGASKAMFDAYSCVEQEGFSPQWLFENDCLNIKEKEKNCVYLFDQFKGEGFRHIRSLNCRILGPQCILSSLQHKMDIPRRSTPILNLAMKDLVVCCTNLAKEARDEIHEKIELMGGEASKTLTDEVTHLIAGEVGSKKYQVSGEMGKQIMLPTWIEQIWTKSLEGHVHWSDAQFHEFRCPIFFGLVITVSGFDSTERGEMKKIIEAEGGKYTGEMKVKECTHLIINKPKGAKYEYAKKWKILVVKSDWLYDSIEKGYCLDESKFALEEGTSHESSGNSESVKTSTPEKGTAASRVSSIGDISIIPNISAISNYQVNETAGITRCNMTTFNETQATKTENIESSLQAIDLTRPPSDMFLDGCKIYLSGFRGQDLEKMRKVINAGGATRLNNLNEAVTHVILGERIEKDISLLSSATFRPQVVTPAWLAECYRNGRTVEETPFYCLELPPLEAASPNLKGKQKQVEKRENMKPKKTLEQDNTKPEDDQKEEDEMDIMSQYMLQPVEGMSQDLTVREENKLQNGETSTHIAMETEPKPAVNEEEDDLTQNPDAENQGPNKLFIGKSFMFFGFEEEHITNLTEFVQEEGGKVYQGNTRLVPDFGIVPIDGFPIDKTVAEIATSTWLQMCVEYENILPVSSNPLFSPVDYNLEDNPLVNCVLSFSGWSGTEKDCLMHIAECIGATTQEYFVRNAKQGLLPTTHLITKEAAGQKFTAAKKWGLPALSKMWILASAKSGNRESEGKYLIENEQNYQQKTKEEFDDKNDNTISKNPNESLRQEGATDVEKETPKQNEIPSELSNQNEQQLDVSKRTLLPQGADTGELAKHGHKLEGDVSIGMETMEAMGACNSEMTIDNNTLPADKSKENIKEDDFSETTTNNQKTLQESQKENFQRKNEGTPILGKVINNRVMALQNDELDTTPKNSTSRKSSLNSPSPGRFLDPSKEWRPHFDLTDVMKCLETPQEEKVRNARKRSSLPLEELFASKLQKAIKITEAPDPTRGDDEVDGSSIALSQQEAGPLKGVVIGVSKKLSSNQADYNNMVSVLGGDYRWTYDNTCTHFIFQGTRANDTTKEFRLAKDQKKIIVSPHWLFMCKEQNAWVDETLFPHNYNPNLTLSVSKRKMGTPARTPLRGNRKTTRSNSRTDSISSLNPETLNFDQEVDRATITKPDVLKPRNSTSDKDTVSESDTENEIRSRLGQPLKETDAEIKSRLGQPLKETDAEMKSRLGQPLKETDAEMKSRLGNLSGDTEKVRGGKRLRKSAKNSSEEEKDPELTQPSVGSMEMREVLSKELESIMAASKPKKATRRRSKRLNCSGSLSCDLSGSGDKSNSRQNRWSLQDEKAEKKTPTNSGKPAETHLGPEASQSVQVTWDDHTGRLEQEKLAHKLERACSPTQDVVGAEFLDGEFSEEEEDVNDVELEDPNPVVTHEEKPEERVPTPEAPSLAFHVSKNTDKRLPSPEAVFIEEENQEKDSKPPVFILSGMTQPEKDNYGALVEQLGGKMLESMFFDTSCTHLVIGNPARNEKFLASVASGKWVLHKSYFEACRQEGKFVKEDFYEWGGDGTTGLLNNTQTAKLASAAHRWRVKVQRMLQEKDHCPGAFDGWTVLLNCDKVKDENFKRLLEAGGANVLPHKPPYPENITASHAFLDFNKRPISNSDIQVLLNNNILCLKPEYIAAHLTDDPSPSPDDFRPAEVTTYINGLSSTDRNKRKAMSLSSSENDNKSKRTRRR